MRAHPLPEARNYADLMLDELRKVIPSFLQRVDVPSRGGEWSDYLASTRDRTARIVSHLWPELGPLEAPVRDGGEPEVALLDFDPDGEEKVLVAACFSHLGCSEREAARRVRQLGHDDRVALLTAYVGDRRNRRHRPGRAFERTDYRFELVTDYGAFRDLQRHRMLTMEWQPLGIALGYDMPELVAEAGLGDRYDEAIGHAEELYRSLRRTSPNRRRTSWHWRTASVTSCSSTHARPCISLSCAPARRATPPTDGWRSRCTGRSPRWPGTAPWPRR